MERKSMVFAAAAVSTFVAAASLGSLAWLYGKVRAYERENGVSVLSASPSPLAGAPEGADGAPVVPNPPAPVGPGHAALPRRIMPRMAPQAGTNVAADAQMKVVKVDYDGQMRLDLTLSERPEMSGIRQYVSVSPLNEGFIGVSYKAVYDSGRKAYVPHLIVTGDFANRTNVTLLVRRGLALYGKSGAPGANGALAEDYKYVFSRRDIDPYVKFVSDGRYLPPRGRRIVEVEAVNRPSVQAEIRRVEPRSVVQLLAREEGEYRRYYGGGGDSEDTAELSGKATVVKAPCENQPNKKEVWRLPVGVDDGGPANGVYLVAAGAGDRPFCDERYRFVNGSWQCEGDWYNPPAWRLVCVSDLGLSVRASEGSGDFGAWIVSLSSGRPVADASVQVYSKSNTLVMEGETDGRGWCRPVRVAEGEPFAVVARTRQGDDMTFMALSGGMRVDETHKGGARQEFLRPDACTGFAWTERGIYRHGERIMLHLILRDGRMSAPRPFPVELQLVDPKGNVFSRQTAMPDAMGSVVCEKFSVPEDQPSGKWTLRAVVPGGKGGVYASAEVKVEEFAPPQIRVKVAATEGVHPTNFAFCVSAEHLFGGPAASLRCEGAVVFEDAPFAPDGWKGYSFGDEGRALKPCYRELDCQELDASGRTSFAAPLWADAGLPRAMVRAIGQGVVFEDGGRPATARNGAMLHYYPYYIGSTLTSWLRRPQSGSPKVRIACVGRDGRRLGEQRDLVVKIERIDSVYSYRQTENGWNTWDCERIRSTVADGIRVKSVVGADTEIALPLGGCGDYALTVRDQATGVSFGRTFYLSDWGDDEVRAPLSNPTEVSVSADKPFYRVGETPRLVVKSPFAGFALMSVMRDRERYTRVLELTNATSEVVLRPVSREDAPNLDVYLSVVQSVEANARHLAVRAHGQTTIRVRPEENEIPVEVSAAVEIAKPGEASDAASWVTVEVAAPGAEAAVVALVDEGINILTGEPTPNPVGWFAQARDGKSALYDLYGRMLPVVDGALKASGVKTGGGFGAEMLGRVSPVGSRRFKPLALWKASVPVAGGRCRAVFALPEFAGEVRVTAVAYSARATGAKSACVKVAPHIVMQPDAPRFVAPGDVFEATLPLRNTSKAAGEVSYAVEPSGLTGAPRPVSGRVLLAPGASTNVAVRLKAPPDSGHLAIVYRASGLGERHVQSIELPVRPAVAWVETNGVCPEGEWKPPEDGKCSSRVFDSPLGEYEAAMRWLADYPHGCLEQTSSRAYPLVAAGGMLAGIVSNGAECIDAGVRRVESMVRENDFVMWPDCTTAPWSREVSIYAAEFLFAAEKGGTRLNRAARACVVKFLKRWVLSKESDTSAYAALVLAQAGFADLDRMFRLYDDRHSLSALSRARLALAFTLVDDRTRAAALLAESFEPASVKEASFALRARLALDPADERVMPLVAWLNARRDKAKMSWGTTEDNAHALIGVGAYFAAHPPKRGERFVAWRKLVLPRLEDVADESEGLSISRRYIRADGSEADLANLKCGDLLVAELSITSTVPRMLNDLVVEDLFAGCMEPVHRDVPALAAQPSESVKTDWVMRRDARDDRMLVFSKRFTLEAGQEARFSYPVRVVSAGEYILPGPSVEGMYDPRLHARRRPRRVVSRR